MQSVLPLTKDMQMKVRTYDEEKIEEISQKVTKIYDKLFLDTPSKVSCLYCGSEKNLRMLHPGNKENVDLEVYKKFIYNNAPVSLAVCTTCNFRHFMVLEKTKGTAYYKLIPFDYFIQQRERMLELVESLNEVSDKCDTGLPSKVKIVNIENKNIENKSRKPGRPIKKGGNK